MSPGTPTPGHLMRATDQLLAVTVSLWKRSFSTSTATSTTRRCECASSSAFATRRSSILPRPWWNRSERTFRAPASSCVPPDPGAELIYSSALMKTVFIVNPASANGATGKQWPQVSERIRERGLEHSAVLTSGPAEATRLAADALESGADTVTAVGGDGTLRHVANGFFGAAQAFADAAPRLLPFGTGGDCRRTLGIPLELEAAIDCLKARKVRRIDVGRVEMEALQGGRTMRHFVNIADAGLGGVVVERVNRTTKLLGRK